MEISSRPVEEPDEIKFPEVRTFIVIRTIYGRGCENALQGNSTFGTPMEINRRRRFRRKMPSFLVTAPNVAIPDTPRAFPALNLRILSIFFQKHLLSQTEAPRMWKLAKN